MTAQLAPTETATAALANGALADYLAGSFPDLASIQCEVGAPDRYGLPLRIVATYDVDGNDISNITNPGTVGHHISNFGYDDSLMEHWSGRIDLYGAIAAARALLPAATCRHCAQEITHDSDNEWIHVESEGVYCGLPINRGNDDTFTAEPTAN